MTQDSQKMNDDDIDPQVEAIRKKLLRLLMVSGAIMIIGFAAVFIGVVYKVNQNTDANISASINANTNAIETPQTIEQTLEDGTELIDAQISGSQLMLTLRMADGSTEVRVYDNQKITKKIIIP